MNEDDKTQADQDSLIDAMIDEELAPDEQKALEEAMSNDPELARRVEQARALERSLRMPRKRAPLLLRWKLRRIPHHGLEFPRWWAFAAIAVVAIAIGLLRTPTEHVDVAESELDAAREDLALAFTYFERYGRMASAEIRSTMDRRVTDPVADNTLRTLMHGLSVGANTKRLRLSK